MKITTHYILIFLSVLHLGCKGKNNINKNKNSQTEATVCVDKSQLQEQLSKVAAWQMDNFTYSTTKNLHDHGISSWTNATFFVGLNEWADTVDNTVVLEWLKDIGQTTEWTVPSNFRDYPQYQLYHADEFCMAQIYLNAYDRYKDPKMLASVRERVQWVFDHPGDPNMNHRNKQSWTWCDALFMAPPVYAHLAAIESDDRYLAFMDAEFKRTYGHLYSQEDQLFFRDDSYFEKVENNGKKVFWGRGNGWVAAGLVSVLKQLPQHSEYRPFYENLFKEFVPRLVSLQSHSGFWHASLLDPESYPAPETSVTALITYALAYGINQNLLDRATYCEVTNKAWKALTSVVGEDGKLGWVQPIGADPKSVTSDMTAPYGVGAFLLAGSELYKMKTEQ